MEVFQTFSKYDIAYSIFERAKVDHTYTSTDGPKLWEIMLNVPAFPALSLSQRLAHLDEARQVLSAEPTPTMYRGAIKLCYDYKDLGAALSLMKSCIVDVQYGMPLNVGLVVDFLTVRNIISFSRKTPKI